MAAALDPAVAATVECSTRTAGLGLHFGHSVFINGNADLRLMLALNRASYGCRSEPVGFESSASSKRQVGDTAMPAIAVNVVVGRGGSVEHRCSASPPADLRFVLLRS